MNNICESAQTLQKHGHCFCLSIRAINMPETVVVERPRALNRVERPRVLSIAGQSPIEWRKKPVERPNIYKFTYTKNNICVSTQTLQNIGHCKYTDTSYNRHARLDIVFAKAIGPSTCIRAIDMQSGNRQLQTGN